MKYISFLSLLISIIPNTYAHSEDELNQKLRKYIETFTIKTPKTIPGKGSSKYELGKLLLEDKDLSLSKTISCKSCHDPKFGTSDALPLSIGAGGFHNGLKSKQLRAGITARSAPHLYNKGHKSFRTMFWDGRVFYDDFDDSYQTPEPGLNGKYPEFLDIASKIENVLAMQALFPMASTLEMRGQEFKGLTNREVWKIIAKRIKKKLIYKSYITEDFNIADIANALSLFQAVEFQVNDTPFDSFIKGDNKSLTLKEKEGALVFFEKGRCSRCHHGVLLSNQAFQGAGIPQIGPGQTKDKNDEGRFLITGKEFHKYGFLTQPLRNIALTAPYMHDGALATLKEVVNHYNNPSRGIDDFSVNTVQKLYGKIYNEFIYVDKNPYRNIYRKQAIAPPIKRPLALDDQQINDLVCFLKKSLTQKEFHRKLNLSECKNL
jgi:cytochrome c peroxidase